MTPLVIVPARVGSQGVVFKNFRKLPDGTTLVTRALAVATKIGDTILTTNSTELLWLPDITRIQRPTELAEDDTPMRAVVQHVLDAVPGPPEQPIVLLEPTTPFRRLEDVRTCLDLQQKYGTPAATVRAVPAAYWRAQPLTSDYMFLPKLRRQEAIGLWQFSGEAYVFPRAWGLDPVNSFRVVRLVSDPYVNVDAPEDWEKACEIIRLGGNAYV
jgi:CMP-N-acetylneuraminic acid synthetase